MSNYKGPFIIKISDSFGKLIETHHLVYSGLMSWRLEKGIWKINMQLQESKSTDVLLLMH